MKTKIAIIGLGRLGLQIARLLKSKYELYPTRKNKNTIKKLKKEFPNISNDNIAAIKKSDIILLMVPPKKVNLVLKEIKPYIDKKLVLNFTLKKFNLNSQLINIASSIVINNKIKICLYKPNKMVTKNNEELFIKIFKSISANFSKCNDPVKEMTYFARVFSHILAYYSFLLKEKKEAKILKLCFELGVESLIYSKSINNVIKKGKTKGGITEELFKLYSQEPYFKDLISSESNIINKKIKEINKS